MKQFKEKHNKSMGGSPGLVIMVDDSCWKVMGSNPGATYWMDIFHIDLLQKLYCLLENTKIH